MIFYFKSLSYNYIYNFCVLFLLEQAHFYHNSVVLYDTLLVIMSEDDDIDVVRDT